MAKQQLPKLWLRVRFPSPAPKKDCNFDTKLQSFLTKSAFVRINPLRGWNRYAMKSALLQVRMADLISSKAIGGRFHPNSFGFHPTKQDFTKFLWFVGTVFLSLQAFFVFNCKKQIVHFIPLSFNLWSIVHFMSFYNFFSFFLL